VERLDRTGRDRRKKGAIQSLHGGNLGGQDDWGDKLAFSGKIKGEEVITTSILILAGKKKRKVETQCVSWRN